MNDELGGQLVWYRQNGRIQLALYANKQTFPWTGSQNQREVRCANLSLPLLSKMPMGVIHRQPIGIQWNGNVLVAGPVFAVLAASKGHDFIGCRTDFRDLMNMAKERRQFVYVLSSADVHTGSVWNGYLRRGYKNWISLPCPHPEAVYNRIPNRNLERSAEAVAAKRKLGQFGIQLFNPDYFNKAVIYDVIKSAGLSRYLPETSKRVTYETLYQMLTRHDAVYLKPAGGSIGHGMMRVELGSGKYHLRVLKNGVCKDYHCGSYTELWNLVKHQRLAGQYVAQAAKRLITHKGRPCDFRVLLQKHQDVWEVVGKGVRVAGPNTITTHVPNGGYITDADGVLNSAFGNRAGVVESTLDEAVIECAIAIDGHYGGKLGEMSMDIGLDSEGHVWFFEANAKPMKFDEKEIREQSLSGVLRHLWELKGGSGRS